MGGSTHLLMYNFEDASCLGTHFSDLMRLTPKSDLQHLDLVKLLYDFEKDGLGRKKKVIVGYVEPNSVLT